MNWPSVTHAPEEQIEVDRMLDPPRFFFFFFFFFECYFDLYAWKTWKCFLSLPLMYKHERKQKKNPEIYHEVSLQYFYNALLKSVTLTTSGVHTQYIFYTRRFFLLRTSECADLEQRNEILELTHCYNWLIIDKWCRNFVIMIYYKMYW